MKTNLYTVDTAIALPVTSKNRLRRILTVLAFCVLAVAPADGTVYEATNAGDLNGHDFGTLNPSTGVFTSINSGGSALVGLGSTGDGTLYGMALFGSTLYQINPVTGVQTPVGDASISAFLFGATTTGLFTLDNSLNLYSINRTNGSSTLIGPTGLPTGNVFGFSSNAGVLYLTEDTGLYSLDTTTGAAQFIGNTGETIGAMVLSSGQLYAAVETTEAPLRLDTLNPMTGAPTAGPNLTGTTQLVWGLATTGVPESGATLLLLFIALAPLLMLRRANSAISLPQVSPGE